MTESELEKIKSHIRTYLDPMLSNDGNLWLEHHIRMILEMYSWAQRDDPDVSLDAFLADEVDPIKLPKPKRRR